jgi:hypothetical protein
LEKLNFVYLAMARKSLYTKRLGIDVAGGARPLYPIRYHVISRTTNGWAVVPEGSVRGLKAFSTQRQAVTFARQTASRKNGEVVIHAKTGQIRDLVSFKK